MLTVADDAGAADPVADDVGAPSYVPGASAVPDSTPDGLASPAPHREPIEPGSRDPAFVGDPFVDRIPGWREVALVAAAIVVGVLALAVLTSVLPTGLQEVVFRTPLTIVILVVVTIGLLLRLARGSTD